MSGHAGVGATAEPGRADDGSLSRQVAATLAAVLVADLLVVVGLAALVRPWLAPLGGALAGVVGLAVPPVVGWVVLVVAGLAAFVAAQARYTRLEALGEAGVSTDDGAPAALESRVTRLAAHLDIAPPTVVLADSRVPNSFVVDGLGDATLVVSAGLVDALDGHDDQLDAVLAHELAHLKNRDALVVALASFLPALLGDGYSVRRDLLPFGRAGGTAVLAAVALALVAGAATVPGVGPAAALAAVGFTLLLAGVGLGVATAPVLLLARRLSRTREFIADRAGALTAGSPAAMASALRTLDDRAPARPTADLRSTTPSTVRALCLLPHGFAVDGPDAGGDALDAAETGDAGGRGGSGDGGFRLDVRAHPPTAERIDRLRELAAALEAGSTPE